MLDGLLQRTFLSLPDETLFAFLEHNSQEIWENTEKLLKAKVGAAGGI